MASVLAIKLWAVPALELYTTCLKPFSDCYTSSLTSNLKQHDSTTGYLKLGLVRRFLSYMKVELPRQVKTGGSLLTECSTLRATLSTFCACYFSNLVILFQELFYHFQFEYQILGGVNAQQYQYVTVN